MPGTSIGVGITYHNEREMLTECLLSLSHQTRPPDEIAVYDDASSDPAQTFIPAGMQVRVLRGETNRGPSYGRNQLFQALRADYRIKVATNGQLIARMAGAGMVLVGFWVAAGTYGALN